MHPEKDCDDWTLRHPLAQQSDFCAFLYRQFCCTVGGRGAQAKRANSAPKRTAPETAGMAGARVPDSACRWRAGRLQVQRGSSVCPGAPSFWDSFASMFIEAAYGLLFKASEAIETQPVRVMMRDALGVFPGWIDGIIDGVEAGWAVWPGFVGAPPFRDLPEHREPVVDRQRWRSFRVLRRVWGSFEQKLRRCFDSVPPCSLQANRSSIDHVVVYAGKLKDCWLSAYCALLTELVPHPLELAA